MHYLIRKKLRAQAVSSNFKHISEEAISVRIHYVFKDYEQHQNELSLIKNKIHLHLQKNIKRLLLNIVKHTRIFNYTLKVSCTNVYSDEISFNFFLKANNTNIGKLYFFDYEGQEPNQLILPRKYLDKLGHHFYCIEPDEVVLKHCNDVLKIILQDEGENDGYRELINKEMKRIVKYNNGIRNLYKDLSDSNLYDMQSALKSGEDSSFHYKYYVEIQYLISDEIKWLIETEGRQSNIYTFKDMNLRGLIIALHECDSIFKQSDIESHLAEYDFKELCDVTKLLNY